MRDKMPKNEKGQAHGHWITYYAPSSDEVWFEGHYINGVEYGYETTTLPYGKGEKIYHYYAR